MLPFFRKIPWRFAQDKQFLKYSRYAVGEIVLVVIGILIALYINNWNEERKNEKKILKILSEVQRDLLSNLQNIERTIDDQSYQDSLFLIVLSDTLKLNDLIENNDLINPIGYHVPTNIITEGFEKLKSNQDNFPQKFLGLYDSIKLMFRDYQIELSNAKSFAEHIDLYNHDIAKIWKWDSRIFYDGELNAQTLSYYLDSTYHRNMIYRGSYILDDQNWFNARLNSYKIYHEISQITGVNNLPEDYKYLLTAKLDEYSGTYKWKDSTSLNDLNKRKIEVEGRVLKYHFDNFFFYQIKKDSFVSYYNNTLYFKRDSSNRIIGAVRYNRGHFFELDKVK